MKFVTRADVADCKVAYANHPSTPALLRIRALNNADEIREISKLNATQWHRREDREMVKLANAKKPKSKKKKKAKA